PEVADVVDDEVGGVFRTAVDQDAAGITHDQDRRYPAGTDEVGVGVDADGWRGPVPVVGVLAGVGPHGSGDLDRRARLLRVGRRLAERDGDLLRGEEEGEANEHSWRR